MFEIFRKFTVIESSERNNNLALPHEDTGQHGSMYPRRGFLMKSKHHDVHNYFCFYFFVYIKILALLNR